MKPRLVIVAVVAASVVLACGCGLGEPPMTSGITITSPAKGDYLIVGTSTTITWETTHVGTANINLTRDGWATGELATTVNLADLSSSWVVTGPASDDCYLGALVSGPPGSSGRFSIVAPGIHLLAPEGGELWVAGESRDISWLPEAAAEAGIANVKIEVSRNGGAWEEIVASTDATTGVFPWTVDLGAGPNVQLECLFRVRDAADGDPFDVSTGFTVLRTSGAIEWRVASTVAPGGDGLTWATALPHPQDAVDLSIAGDELWVAGGTYVRRDVGDTVVLDMRSGVSVYGGFAGVEAVRSARDWTLNTTTLDGEDAAQHVVMGMGLVDVTFDGFTVTGGNAVGTYDGLGAGMYLWFSQNIVLANTIFTQNAAETGGGGIYVRGAVMSFSDCLFDTNTAGSGGAVLSSDSTLLADRCRFLDNVAAVTGAGGLDQSHGAATLSNCVFESSIGVSGGDLNLQTMSASVSNSTFVDGSAQRGDCLFSYDADVTFVNCIIWPGSSLDTIFEADVGASTTVTYSDVRGGFPGTGNIDTAPLFVDAVGGDYHLQAGSPCIDTADPATTLTEDIEGTPRPAGSGYDMGAYERTP